MVVQTTMTTQQQKDDLAALAGLVWGNAYQYVSSTLQQQLEEYGELMREMEEDGYDTTWLKTLNPDDITLSLAGVDIEVEGLVGLEVKDEKKEKKKDEDVKSIDITKFMK